MDDSTSAAQRELRLQRLARMYRTISRCNHHLIRAQTEADLAQGVCETMVDEGPYVMAWIGYAMHDEPKTILPFAFAGLESGYLKDLNLTWADTERGSGPGARTIREGIPQVTRDILGDPRFAFWREEAARRGYASSIGLPLRDRDGTFGFLGIYATEPDAFDDDEVKLLVEVADDLAFGITTLRDRARREELEVRVAERTRELEYAQAIGHIGSWLSGADDAARAVWSDETYRILGLDRAMFEPTEEAFLALVHGDDVEAVRAAHLAGLRTGEPFELEHRIVRPDGSIRWVIERGERAPERPGHPARLFGVVQDVTEQRELQSQLRQAAKTEALGRLAGGIAHDFNNLLTVIGGFGQILRDSLTEDDSLVADAEQVIAATDRAALLTRQLLAFGRQQVLRPEVLDVATVATGLESMLRRLLGERIELEVVGSPGPAFVKADRGQLEQVIVNLAVNARDAMPEGGRLVIETGLVELGPAAAHAHPATSAGSWVTLSVIDTGVGMDEATVGRIFEPFFTTREHQGGSGLGLATVDGIVAQSGGHIEVSSELGQGTCFTVYLPESPEPGLSLPGPRAPTALNGSETVLLVEDDASVRRFAGRVLGRAGYRVLLARDGEDALEIARASTPPIDLLITDIGLPRLRGPDLAKRLRQTRPDLPVILVSGYAERAAAVLAQTADPVPFLAKPYSASGLTTMVRQVLDGLLPQGTVD